MKETKLTEAQCQSAMRDLPGMAVDAADNEKVNRKEVDAETKELNNNPRNTDDAMPVNPD